MRGRLGRCVQALVWYCMWLQQKASKILVGTNALVACVVYFCQENQQLTTTGATFKVLVVDDSNTIRRSAEIFLKQGGHEVLLADDGFDALSKVNDYQPQLIFCDILMPKLDGYQTVAIIKRNPRFADTPVVMLSSKDGVFDKARGRMVGCQEYLTKPFTKDQLLQAVQQFGNIQQGAK